MGLGIPVVVSERNDPQRSNKYLKILRACLYYLASGFVFQTEQAMNYFHKKIRRKSIVIPNPLFIDVEPVNTIDRKKEIISVGRLVPQKNHEHIILAFKKIANKYQDYKLLIYGEGSLRENLHNLIKDTGLEKKIILKGVTTTLHEEIKNAQIFVLASEFEGMPNALMEAMGLGLACISTDCPSGGPAVLINNKKNGILVPVGDINAIAESIEYLIQNDSARIDIANEAIKIRDLMNHAIINKKWRDFLLSKVK